MEKVINTYIEVAGKAEMFNLILKYQWIVLTAEQTEIDVLDALMAEKAKGF